MPGTENFYSEMEANQKFENFTAQELLEWALKEFHPRIAFACSFQAEESVLIDMIIPKRDQV